MSDHKLPEGAATDEDNSWLPTDDHVRCWGSGEYMTWDGEPQFEAMIRNLCARIRHEVARADWDEQQLIVHIERADWLEQHSRDHVARAEKAERERDRALSREASLCDLLNTWARESNVEEAERQEDAKAVADRLWHAASSRINALERERDGYLNALEQVRRELGAAREALASVVYVRDGTIYMLGEVGEQDPEGGGREWRSGLLNEQAVKDIEFARMAHDEMMNDWSDAEAENERLRRELDELREALAYIASEESGWTFKRDPLEHARSVIEEMRAMAQDVLAALDSGSGGAATRKDAVATPSGEAYQAAPGAADSTEGSD